MDFRYELIKKSNNARRGRIYTAHGIINTPVFMPVGTQGTVKAMLNESIKQTGAEIILGNTYHLMLRPSAELIGEMGGLHKFMNWDKPILTDSGGFQVMSLSALRKITEEGVKFKSHIDGSSHMLSPERSMEIQHLLGSDITMAFDECTSYPITHSKAKASMELSMRWAERSKAAFIKRPGYALFGIMQGSTYKDLREISAGNLIEIGFDGYAIGGNLAVGIEKSEGQKIMFDMLDFVNPLLPFDKPRYLMGVGKPADIIGAVKRGIDMFDCVIPTRSGRNGQAFTKAGTVNIKNTKYINSKAPLEEDCNCPACKDHTMGYLNHLIKAGEILGAMLLTWHNISYFQNLMRRLQNYIEQDIEIDFIC